MSEHFFRPILFSGHSRVGGGSSAAAPKFCGVFRGLSDSFLKKDYVKGSNRDACHWDTPFSFVMKPKMTTGVIFLSIKKYFSQYLTESAYFQFSLFLNSHLVESNAFEKIIVHSEKNNR